MNVLNNRYLRIFACIVLYVLWLLFLSTAVGMGVCAVAGAFVLTLCLFGVFDRITGYQFKPRVRRSTLRLIYSKE